MLLPLAIGSLFLAAASERSDDDLKRAWFLDRYEDFAELVFKKSPEEVDKIEKWLQKARMDALNPLDKVAIQRAHKFLVHLGIQRTLLELIASKTLSTGQSMDGRYFSVPLKDKKPADLYYVQEALRKVTTNFGEAAQRDLLEQRGLKFEIEIAAIPIHESDEKAEFYINMDEWPDGVAFGPPVEDFFVSHNITVYD